MTNEFWLTTQSLAISTPLEMFEFANYIQTLGNNAPDSIYLYSAIGLLLIGQIFKIARQMKEEQELTI